MVRKTQWLYRQKDTNKETKRAVETSDRIKAGCHPGCRANRPGGRLNRRTKKPNSQHLRVATIPVYDEPGGGR